ncbi:hypothetical protein [Bordetella holmesii]|uniref:Lipoprotein n=2 Tax=Bordetella holmesii TaxID=35814 RepID=A0ABN0S025_9BORD|nr:hypothetical protein [Bordetella holmesii]AHV92695.1 hypothetical protein D560_0357 [Bordetella holmesii ATCC 51541]AIT25043.1 hypothetical protein D558_0352 [Bordetella holmesii 44057]EWM45609.1 hypothetical protein D557_3615 [Bordetella holmesii 70147]EWM48594.1 hypothetical protein D556_0355 [Bordetella holmesii 41130]EWM49730.1 hypothetical protein D555_0356 [Bordetella holmesii 35009]
MNNALVFGARALVALCVFATCASITGCARQAARGQDGIDYRSRAPDAGSEPGRGQPPSNRRLTIQSGEGERLNLPWFIQDTENWINGN